jgi:fructosamine-3-kinase
VWPEFYRGLYNTIWRETEKSGLIPVKCRKQINKVHDRLERLISHSDCPRLLHGDLWASNILAAADDSGRWRVTGILDPWSKFGHTEAELAYLELFHTVTPAFMKVYQASHRISPDYYRIRRPIYQLYPMINHVHLFGQEYLKQLIAMVERTTSLV